MEVTIEVPQQASAVVFRFVRESNPAPSDAGAGAAEYDSWGQGAGAAEYDSWLRVFAAPSA